MLHADARDETSAGGVVFRLDGGHPLYLLIRDSYQNWGFLKGHLEACKKLGGEWMVVHAGHHFTSDKKMRMEAGLERLKRLSGQAEKLGITLLLENMNWEPDDAEVHYLGYSLEECRYYFDNLSSPRLRWAFTVNHAHLVPEGIEGFVDALDMRMVGEVRLADCFRNGHEQHLKPGTGNLDFGDMFRRIEGKGFKGHYTNAFTTLDDMLWARDYLADAAMRAGVTA